MSSNKTVRSSWPHPHPQMKQHVQQKEIELIEPLKLLT